MIVYRFDGSEFTLTVVCNIEPIRISGSELSYILCNTGARFPEISFGSSVKSNCSICLLLIYVTVIVIDELLIIGWCTRHFVKIKENE